jgi:DNA-binding Lrp family transcriptional regulator
VLRRCIKDSKGGHILIKPARGRQKERERERDTIVDELDLKLLNLLQLGYDNKKIATTVNSPLSTVQRRTRLILENGLASSRVEPDYAKLGYKKGFLIICANGSKNFKIIEILEKIRGIISISANVGNFQIICTVAFRNKEELWELISKVQEIDNVKDVFWSEEIYYYHL